MNRSQIEARLRDWMTSKTDEVGDDAFSEIALALFKWQFDHCAPYARFCAGRSRTPEQVRRWQDIPAVPTGAFKETDLRGFDVADTVKTFRTSGTSVGPRGELHLDTLALYEASLLPSFETAVLAGFDAHQRVPLFILAPSGSDAPDSSLSHMFDVLRRERGTAESACFIERGELAFERLEAAVASTSDAPVICGTAFAFVHWMDARSAAGIHTPLPAGTRLMETGGFKGRARERTQDVLYREIEQAFRVSEDRIINQYGMTELGSQFYDSILATPSRPRHKRVPAWVRVRMIDPLTDEEVPHGAVGMIQILDLANTGSVASVLTADLGRAVASGFEVIGRDPEAEARGCSIALDEMLGDER